MIAGADAHGTASEADPTLAALGRAARFRALAQVLAYPTPVAVERALDSLRALSAAATDLPAAVRRGVERVEAELATADLEALAAEHVRLFGPAGRCAVHETAYGDAGRSLGRPAQLADIAGFYRAFGLEPSEREPLPEDHLRMQLEFLSVLALKEAWAREQQLDDALAVTVDTQRKFLGEHVAAWLDAWNTELIAADADSLYRVAGALVRDAARAECERLGVVPSVISQRAVDAEMGGDALECPRATEVGP